MKLGILSDTHGLLRPEVLAAFTGCDAILHGGDINKQEIIDKLKEIAPTYAVRGNNDKEWAEELPTELSLDLGGIRIYMTHKKKDIPSDTSGYQLVIFGHSHKYSEQTVGDTFFLNPGSCGPRRFDQDITLATADVTDGKIFVSKILIPHDSCPCKRSNCKIHGDCMKCRETHKDSGKTLPCEKKPNAEIEDGFMWTARKFEGKEVVDEKYFPTLAERDEFVKTNPGWKKRGKICAENRRRHHEDYSHQRITGRG